ncbi:MAG: ribose-5-phosphate isomerase RpiA [Gammaproteobacteria bacterium]|nr:ribose-5-phosphate isomerase RpiA [Gammaproteobacteria bacterium]
MNPVIEAQKKSAAESAIAHIEYGMTLGVGSGSTVHYFIEALRAVKGKIDAVVASSLDTEKRVKALGIPVIELNSVSNLPLYVDGADEINAAHQMIKGGGAALTREKIIAAASDKFVCIVDQSKQVELLGAFPVPVEVIPMARSFVARELVKLGGRPVWRENVITDNGNAILDVFNLKILNPIELEMLMNQIPGVVTNGIFARRPADEVIVGK